MPIVTVAELRAGFLHGQKSNKYGPILDDFVLDTRTTILHITDDTVPIYAELYAYSRSVGKQLPGNDLWIAALCVQHNYPLLTFDKDFDVLPQVRRVRV
jgi:predicted nucleic acid-binding protein